MSPIEPLATKRNNREKAFFLDRPPLSFLKCFKPLIGSRLKKFGDPSAEMFRLQNDIKYSELYFYIVKI